jgi:putative ABC transport system substrate-binding protein
MWDSPTAFPDAMLAFREALHELGYIEGQTIIIEYRYAAGDFERMRAFAEEFVRLKVDAIVAPSSIYTAAAKRTTAAIPIIFMSHADPLGTGHVATLSRPGGNVTGLSLMMTETNVKLLEIYKEAMPTLSRLAVVHDPFCTLAYARLKGIGTRWASTWRENTAGGGQRIERIRKGVCCHGPRAR